MHICHFATGFSSSLAETLYVYGTLLLQRGLLRNKQHGQQWQHTPRHMKMGAKDVNMPEADTMVAISKTENDYNSQNYYWLEMNDIVVQLRARQRENH